MSASGTKRTFLFTPQMSAIGGTKTNLWRHLTSRARKLPINKRQCSYLTATRREHLSAVELACNKPK